MREMKDSGIEWIGEISKDWKVKRCKNISNFINGYAFDSKAFQNDFLYSVIRIGDIKEGYIDNINCLGVSNNKGLDRYLIKENDILLAMSGATVGKVGIAHGIKDAYINQRVGIIRTTSPRFLFYCLSTREFIEYILLRADGSAQPNVSGDVYGEFYIPYPRLEEQNNISDFLDTKCSEIDATAEDIQKEIDLLEEYKKSVITEAVTKGLNPDAEMKDSGVEWIGEIPKHWEIIRIGYILGEIDRRSITGMEESLSVSQVLGVVPSSQIAVPSTASTMVGQKIVEPGELVLNKLKAHLGVCFVSNYKGLVSPDYAVYKANEKVKSKLLEYVFHTASCIWEFKKYITGVGQGLSRLYTKDLFRINVALPDMLEQQQIVSYLDSKCSEIDTLIADKKRQLDILADYKKSLIYEYVTGKKEVPVKDF